ncbi:hypothetical protein HNQ77_002935 [Silvibacterium bohemicum]|uniref:Uncharacterized protein n=1 Tax=Silvibacterium bohemicum TaxID=1577686 RepID=A0A841JZ39_9BACT|nr:hypothetical protein [Silvibacterium bohemicum]
MSFGLKVNPLKTYWLHLSFPFGKRLASRKTNNVSRRVSNLDLTCVRLDLAASKDLNKKLARL